MPGGARLRKGQRIKPPPGRTTFDGCYLTDGVDLVYVTGYQDGGLAVENCLTLQGSYIGFGGLSAREAGEDPQWRVVIPLSDEVARTEGS